MRRVSDFLDPSTSGTDAALVTAIDTDHTSLANAILVPEKFVIITSLWNPCRRMFISLKQTFIL
jgi:hypothetical protein